MRIEFHIVDDMELPPLTITMDEGGLHQYYILTNITDFGWG